MATVAAKLIEFLQKNGVTTLYGVTGDVIFPFFDALSRQEEIRYIGTNTEAGAAFMASCQAKLTGCVGVCIATSGPGVASLVNGLADAFFDRVPVLAITGQVASEKIGTGVKQDINQQQLLQAVTASTQLATNKDAVLPLVARALEEAVVKQTVAHVAIPEDLFDQTVCAELPALASQTLALRGGGFSGPFEDAVRALQESQRPVILVGSLCMDLKEPLLQLATAAGAGVLVAQQTKGLIPEDHPRVLGGVGPAHVPDIFSEVDCLLQFGTASFETKFLPPRLKTIQIVKHAGQLDHRRVNIPLIGNLRDAALALLERISGKENPAWEDRLVQERKIRDDIIEEQRQNQGEPIHPAHLMTCLAQHVPDDAIIVCDIGSYVHWFDAYFRATQQRVLTSSNWRSMGSGLPGALAVALNSDKPVIALLGDGGLLTALPELATASKYGIPLTILVANNHLYDLERQQMERQSQTPMGVDVCHLDFAALARVFGCEGKTIAKARDLSILKEIRSISGPVVFDVQLGRETLPFL